MRKMGLSFLVLYSNFHYSPEEIFLVLGAWVVLWPGWVGPPAPPPPVDKHIPARGRGCTYTPGGGGVSNSGWGSSFP